LPLGRGPASPDHVVAVPGNDFIDAQNNDGQEPATESGEVTIANTGDDDSMLKNQ